MNSRIDMRRSELLIWTLLWGGIASLGMAQGIPEPDLVMYGRVLNITSNANLRLGYGTVTFVFRPVGGASPITGSAPLTNINNQFSYILRIPCETPVAGFAASTNTIQLTAAGITFDRSQVTWNSNLVSFAQPSLTNTVFFSSDRGRIERVDLTVSSPIVMDPLNGLPVDWELSHFGRTGIDPLADPDGDGMNNLAEYRAGTDPNDPTSALRFTEILPVPGAIRLKWLSADFKVYALQRALGPSGTFVDLTTGIPGTAPANTYFDATAAAPGTYYYRLRLVDSFSVPTAAPLRFVSIRADPSGGIRVDWLSATNQLYTLQRSSNLSTGFVDLASGIVATPPTNSYLDAMATGGGPYFYRLRLDNGPPFPPAAMTFVSVQLDPLGGVRLGWLSSSNQLYALQRSSMLSTGFEDIQINLSATPPTNFFRDSTATGTGPYFYRLRLQP